MSMSKRVLVVEDEVPLAAALETKLTQAGFEVTVAHTGEAAQKAYNPRVPFDLVTLDLVMPQGDGFEVLEYLRNAGFTNPVIVLTNLSQRDDYKEAKDLGATECYIKTSVSLADVVGRIIALLST